MWLRFYDEFRGVSCWFGWLRLVLRGYVLSVSVAVAVRSKNQWGFAYALKPVNMGLLGFPVLWRVDV